MNGKQELPQLLETRQMFEQLRPEDGASLREWFDYHMACAQMLVILASVQADPQDTSEVMRHAGQETLRARAFQARMATATN